MGRLLSIYHYTLLNELSTAVCYCISAAKGESPRTSVMLGFDFGRQRLTPAGAGSSHPALRMPLEDKRCRMVPVVPRMLCRTPASPYFLLLLSFSYPTAAPSGKAEPRACLQAIHQNQAFRNRGSAINKEESMSLLDWYVKQMFSI